MIENMKNAVLICCTAILFIGCNKSVFYYSDADGESTFVLYNKNYKYSEKTKDASFKTHGTYEATDSTLSFTQFGKDNIPYIYPFKKIEIQDENSSSDSITITVIDNPSMKPILFASIAFLNAKGKIIDGVETNLKGEAKIPMSTNYHSLEISYIGYVKVRVDNEKFRNKDFRIEIEEIKRGEGTISGCSFTFLDVILEYKVNQKRDFSSFSRNGVVYKKIN